MKKSVDWRFGFCQSPAMPSEKPTKKPQRSDMICFALTADEAAKIRREADLQKLSVSAYVRRKLSKTTK